MKSLGELLAWLWIPVVLVSLGLVLTGVPEDAEGPTLLIVGSEHGLTASNALAVLLLLSGTGALILGVWRNIEICRGTVEQQPLAAGVFSLGLLAGILLLINSGVSTMLRLWAPGVLLSTSALIGLAALVSFYMSRR